MNATLQQVYFGNTVQAYLIAVGMAVGGILVLRLLKRTLLRWLAALASRTHTHFDDGLVESVRRFGLPALAVLITYFSLHALDLSVRVAHALRIAATVAVTYFVLRAISVMVREGLHSYVGRQDNGVEKVKQLGGVMLLVNIAIWSLGLLFLFNNMGYDITAIVAGLGIGGIAIALAAQNILGDLFNYFVIFFDRPFEVGDFVVVGDDAGAVEYIGIKTTRVRSLSGEQLVFANSDLTNSRIHNYKRMEQRRILFRFGVLYQTTADQLKEIPGAVRTIVEGVGRTRFDRAHFVSFGDSSLDFEVVYFVLSSEYNVYMDVQQAINIALFRRMDEMGVGFAYPTRTLFIEGYPPAAANKQQQAIGEDVERVK